ncbi:hypothetical protein ACE1TF_11625 [Geomicrobium sp. JSM 1781026]|uniref:hypothetical protein n=1 Tax=Geomicrobium sp. JSM 1781026 TaxID=3344580 RepID=UPI0035C1D72E
MKQNVSVFIEYKVVNRPEQYEILMQEISKELLTAYDASHHRWFQAVDQPGLYVEWLEVGNKATYERIKSERRDRDHPVFGQLAAHIHKPLETINCWAFNEMRL